VFEHMILRKLFGPNWEQLIRSWRYIHNKEVHNLCSLGWETPQGTQVIKEGKMDGGCGMDG